MNLPPVQKQQLCTLELEISCEAIAGQLVCLLFLFQQNTNPFLEDLLALLIN